MKHPRLPIYEIWSYVVHWPTRRRSSMRLGNSRYLWRLVCYIRAPTQMHNCTIGVPTWSNVFLLFLCLLWSVSLSLSLSLSLTLHLSFNSFYTQKKFHQRNEQKIDNNLTFSSSFSLPYSFVHIWTPITTSPQHQYLSLFHIHPTVPFFFYAFQHSFLSASIHRSWNFECAPNTEWLFYH